MDEFIKVGLYKEIKFDYTNKYQAQMEKVLKRVTFLTERLKKLFTETNPEAPRFRSQVKLHKNGMLMRL